MFSVKAGNPADVVGILRALQKMVLMHEKKLMPRPYGRADREEGFAGLKAEQSLK